MTTRQFLALLTICTVTFLALLATGGYIYLTNPALLGIAPQTHSPDTITAPPALWEIEVERARSEQRRLQSQLMQLRDSLARLQRHLSQLNTQYTQAQQQLASTQATLAALQRNGQKDSLRLKNLRMLAEMYDRADPGEVAKILANSDSQHAAQVLALMKRKTAARVLEQLPKDKAVAISQAVVESP